MSRSKIGSNVDSWCTRCKMILAHTIEAMVGSQIMRVSCNTCQGKHQFKATAPGEPRSTSSASSPRRSVPATSSGKYDTLLQGRDLSEAAAYSFQTRYVQGALLKHPDFGVGVVLLDKGSNKIEVSFEAGNKILVHGR